MGVQGTIMTTGATVGVRVVELPQQGLGVGFWIPTILASVSIVLTFALWKWGWPRQYWLQKEIIRLQVRLELIENAASLAEEAMLRLGSLTISLETLNEEWPDATPESRWNLLHSFVDARGRHIGAELSGIWQIAFSDNATALIDGLEVSKTLRSRELETSGVLLDLSVRLREDIPTGSSQVALYSDRIAANLREYAHLVGDVDYLLRQSAQVLLFDAKTRPSRRPDDSPRIEATPRGWRLVGALLPLPEFQDKPC